MDRFKDWKEIVSEHPYTEDTRGIGLADMAYAIRDHRPERASSEMAYHALEAMTGLLTSSAQQLFYQVKSTCSQPSPLPKNFPHSEQA
ncbi:hypothetical protein [Domibacillus enclensis]|nr:hypothetical protein [Domibacillus enclensis]